MSEDRFTVAKITTQEVRDQALKVFDVVYVQEKGWVGNLEEMLPKDDLNREEVDWFAVFDEGKVVGVVRVLYEIPMELYKEYGFELSIPGLDVEKFVAENKIAEVGRFAVYPDYRKQIRAVALLMREAGMAAYNRGWTHFITDVFEDDPNTPHGFHERVLGFKEVATHMHGELKTDSRRITMLLDLNEAAKRMTAKKGWFYRFLRPKKLRTDKDSVSS